MSDQHEYFMRQAIEISVTNVESGQGGPFGAVIVRNGVVIATGTNLVTSLNDPTAHAEVQAIRKACEALQSFQLTDCQIYSSCEPCPMCLGAIYWARLDRLFYGNTKSDAAKIGFDDQFIYEELDRPPAERRLAPQQILSDEAIVAFQKWELSEHRIDY